MAAEILAAALLLEGQWVNAFPMFGFERRGAPVTAFVRFDDQPIKQRTQIYQPHCLIVTDPVFVGQPAIYAGLEPGGAVVLNTLHPAGVPSGVSPGLIALVDATGVALEEMGRPITNTCMLGAFARATGWVSRESLLLAIGDYFEGAALEANRRCIRRGYDQTRVVAQGGGGALP